MADAYLVIMKDLGVEINLQKSLISTTKSLEFAKRLVVRGTDVSPYGPKSIFQAINAPRSSLEFLLSVMRTEGTTNELDIVSLFELDQLKG